MPILLKLFTTYFQGATSISSSFFFKPLVGLLYMWKKSLAPQRCSSFAKYFNYTFISYLFIHIRITITFHPPKSPKHLFSSFWNFSLALYHSVVFTFTGSFTNTKACFINPVLHITYSPDLLLPHASHMPLGLKISFRVFSKELVTYVILF